MIEIEMVEMFKCTCRFCSYIWKVDDIPSRCAKCKKSNWNRDENGKECTVVPEKKKSVEKKEAAKEIIKKTEEKMEAVSRQIGIVLPSVEHNENCTCMVCKIKRGKL